MIADKIKMLRNANNMTQSELARKLNITRSSVNAWEMGISIPSTTFIDRTGPTFSGFYRLPAGSSHPQFH